MAYLLCLRLSAFLIVVGGCLSALPESSLTPEEQWTAFKIEFNKIYPNQAEHDRRKLIFFKTLAKIEYHNTKLYNVSDPNAPHFTLAINDFGKF